MSRPSSSARPRPPIKEVETTGGQLYETAVWGLEWPTPYFPYFVATKGKIQHCIPVYQVARVSLQSVHDFDHEGNIIP